MLKKEELIVRLDRSLKLAYEKMKREYAERPSLHIMNADTLEFNIEAILTEWATDKGINFTIVDIPRLTEKDIKALPKILSVPTVLLLKNFGDFAYDTEIDYLRNNYRSLIKDCVYGGDCVFANNFLFAVATTTKDKPIRDLSERSCFCHLNAGEVYSYENKILEDALGNKYEFVFQTEILAEVDEVGNIISYNPANKYKKKATTRLNEYGELDFCYLVKMNLCNNSGVYAIYENGVLTYIGRAKNLNSRWGKVNYGTISPKNCYVGGQSTNCKINNYIYTKLKEGKKLELYFCKTINYKEIEKKLLDRYAAKSILNKQKH